jgi:archaellum biogenesis ATPase FlaH
MENQQLSNIEDNFLKINPIELYKTNSQFDNLEEGGFIPGTIIEIIGKESSGKTMLMLSFIHELQKNYFPIVYIDTEYCFSENFAQELGITPENLPIITDSNLDEILQILKHLYPSYQYKFIIIDSFAGLTHLDKFYELIEFITNNKIVLIYTNQLRLNLKTRKLTSPTIKYLRKAVYSRVKILQKFIMKDGTDIVFMKRLKSSLDSETFNIRIFHD